MVDSPPRRSFGWPHAIALLGAVLVAGALATGWLLLRATREAGEAIASGGREALEQVEAIARAFRTGTITTTFRSHATRVAGTQRLQFATLDQVEVFERTDSTSVLWGQLALPDVVVRATAPVQYTYFVDFADEWSFELEDERRILVRAPRIRFNRPAVDASALEYEVRQGSALRDEDAAVDKLREGIGSMAHRRAQENVALVREVGRREVEEFVETWLFRDFGEEARRYDVEVVFADEESELPLPGKLRLDGERASGARDGSRP
jgi:hypothetical protein